jgi:predicted nucleic-acid-binding Zn-ribbon protein
MIFTIITTQSGKKFFAQLNILLLLLNLLSFISIQSTKYENKLCDDSQNPEFYSISSSQIISLTVEKKNSANEQDQSRFDEYIDTLTKNRITASLSILSKSYNGAVRFNFFLSSHFATST